MESAYPIVSGSIINELSERIPSNFMALNELIKNSYDAFSTTININFDYKDSKLIISDNGIGMTDEQVRKTFFHIGKSNKSYGQTQKHKSKELSRLVQGSKGLGFLAALKFGAFVKWTTRAEGQNQGISFEVNRDEISACLDISKYEVKIENASTPQEGTIIEIYVDDYYRDSLQKELTDEISYKKIISSLKDLETQINIRVSNGNINNNNDLNTFVKILPKKQFCSVKYSSKTSRVTFFYMKDGVKDSMEYALSLDKYTLDFELVIYSLASRDPQKISYLFHRETDDQLTPIIYINSSLFKNYDIFNPGIFRVQSSGSAMPQQIGYINIVSDSDELTFNADRTQLVQNALTDALKKDLLALNRLIQETASKHKNKNKNKNKKRGEDPPSPPRVSVPKITLYNKTLIFDVPANPLALKEQIKSATNGHGKDVTDSVIIKEDNKELKDRILGEVNEAC